MNRPIGLKKIVSSYLLTYLFTSRNFMLRNQTLRGTKAKASPISVHTSDMISYIFIIVQNQSFYVAHQFS